MTSLPLLLPLIGLRFSASVPVAQAYPDYSSSELVYGVSLAIIRIGRALATTTLTKHFTKLDTVCKFHHMLLGTNLVGAQFSVCEQTSAGDRWPADTLSGSHAVGTAKLSLQEWASYEVS